MADHHIDTKTERIHEKLAILSDAAKYDASCSSSGSKRQNHNKGLGDATGMGICHSYTEDGRCVSLLKLLMTNYCIYDCAYCVSRKSNDIKRAAFTVEEIVSLTINFYRRNYIEGLFLSSGIFKDADFTMERLVRVAKTLREEHNFNGYIHLKTIPGASEELMKQAGLYADRLSVNIEMPTESALQQLAPEKNMHDILTPMLFLSESIQNFKEEKALVKSAPLFAPAGQSTQMVIGATDETDKDILFTASNLYTGYKLKRVYYSGYVPIRTDTLLPGIGTPPPLIREHRLYQSDWLMRFYKFSVNEIVNDANPVLDADIDPKLGWALRNLHRFPVDVNKDDYELILRIPGVGVQSAKKIVMARRYGRLNKEKLKNLGVAMNRADYFIACDGKNFVVGNLSAAVIRGQITAKTKSKFAKSYSPQLNLF